MLDLSYLPDDLAAQMRQDAATFNVHARIVRARLMRDLPHPQRRDCMRYALRTFTRCGIDAGLSALEAVGSR